MSVATAESERDSFDAFVRARMPGLLRFAHALTGDPHTAADLVQDALVRTGMRWSRLDHNGDPEAYVRRAIINGRTSRMPSAANRPYAVSTSPSGNATSTTDTA